MAAPLVDVSRDARGLAILLLYAAYEHLLKDLARNLLDTAISLRVGNRSLRPGLQVFAIYNKLQAVADSRHSAIWSRHGIDLIETLTASRSCSVASELFPDDGSHMRRSQIASFCRIFGLGNPAPVLREVWDRIDGIVAERNAIAHGALTPDEVGRQYTFQELDALVRTWEDRWLAFLEWTEAQASSRDFFRVRRR